MLVFGGDMCGCMRVLEMWKEQFAMPPELFTTMQTWLGPNAHLAPKEFKVPRELGMILSWERAWRQTAWLHRKQPRLLEIGLKERALGPLREHLTANKARCGARMVSQVAVGVVSGDTTPIIEGRVEGIGIRATARLHGTWVVHVWGRGVAVVDGAFVLEVVEIAAGGSDLGVKAVRWEQRGERAWVAVSTPARVTRDDTDCWRLSWDDGGPDPTDKASA